MPSIEGIRWYNMTTCDHLACMHTDCEPVNHMSVSKTAQYTALQFTTIANPHMSQIPQGVLSKVAMAVCTEFTISCHPLQLQHTQT